MSVETYEGHEVATSVGRVLTKAGAFGVRLAFDFPDEGSAAMTLTTDEAFQVALALLRDVSLSRYGSG